MEIKLNNLKVLHSGVIFCEKEDLLKFDFEEMLLKVRFTDDPNRKKSIDFNVKENSYEAELKIYNIDSNKHGLFKPFELGTLKGKKIYLAFSAQKMNTNDSSLNGYQFVYCWYLEE